MTEIGREILKNVYETIDTKRFCISHADKKRITSIDIIGESPLKTHISLSSKKFNRLSKEKVLMQGDLMTIVEKLFSGPIQTNVILAITIPVLSFDNKNYIYYIASPYAVVLFEKNIKFNPIPNKTMFMRLTSGLSNIIGVTSMVDGTISSVQLLPNVEKILYKKEDIFEYLV